MLTAALKADVILFQSGKVNVLAISMFLIPILKLLNTSERASITFNLNSFLEFSNSYANWVMLRNYEHLTNEYKDRFLQQINTLIPSLIRLSSINEEDRNLLSSVTVKIIILLKKSIGQIALT